MRSHLAEVLLRAEPLWTVLALAFTYVTLLWGLGWSWVGLAIAALAFPLRWWRLGYPSRRTPLDVPVALLLIASLVSTGVSPDRALSLRAFESVLACIFLYYSLVNMPHPLYVRWGFASAAVLVFVAGMLAFRAGFEPPSALAGFGDWLRETLHHVPQLPQVSSIRDPVMGTAHGLTVALEMVLLPLIGFVVFTSERHSGMAAAVATVPFLLLLLLFGSQGAWLAVGVGFSALLVWRCSRSAAPLAVLVCLGYLGYRQGWLNPASMLTDFDPGQSLRVRIDLWKEAIEVIGRHPVAGCGLGCFAKYSTTAVLSPHNAYLQFYADMGIAGLVAFVATVIAAISMAVDLARGFKGHPWYGFAVGIVAAAAAIAVHGMFESSPAGIMAEAADGYFYVVSPVLAILAGLFVRTKRLVDE